MISDPWSLTLGGGNHLGQRGSPCQISSHANEPKGADHVLDSVAARVHAPSHSPGVPAARAGPFPDARPENVTVIFVVVLVAVIWLLARGYPAGTAVEAVAGAGAVSAAIASRLAWPTQDADN